MSQSEQEQKLKKLLSGADGKRLLQLLNQDGGNTLRAAGNALKQGNSQQVKELMGPLLNDPEVQKLLGGLESKMNHG